MLKCFTGCHVNHLLVPFPQFGGCNRKRDSVVFGHFHDQHQFGAIDFSRLHPQSLGHDRGEKIYAKKKNDVAVSLGVLGIARE